MMRSFSFLLSVALLLAALSAGCSTRSQAAPEESADPVTVFAMDTVMELTPYGPRAGEAGALAASRLRELEALLSTTDENSEIYQINHSPGTAVPISSDTAALLESALCLCEETKGALDISIYPVVRAWGFTTGRHQVPSRETLDRLLAHVDAAQVDFDPEARTVTVPEGVEIDLGSVAKGYAGDQILDLFRDCGITSAILNLGGNVQTLGPRPDGSPWRVAVQSPNGTGYVGVLEVSDQAVVTSGGYERYFEENGQVYWHIIDPATGSPARNGILSATVTGASGLVCDGLSTALFILGPEEAEALWRERGGFEYLLITEEEELILTPGLADCFTPSDDWADHTLTVVTP